MAQIRIHEINTRIENEVEVSKFLQEEGVLYEKWNISKLPTHLKRKLLLTDENKAQILAVFSKEIADVSARRGYKAHDVISLSNSTPNLDELLINFKEHHHTDDEVRFIVSGHGIFAIEGKDGTFFDVELEPAISYLFLKMQDIILPCKMIVKL